MKKTFSIPMVLAAVFVGLTSVLANAASNLKLVEPAKLSISNAHDFKADGPKRGAKRSAAELSKMIQAGLKSLNFGIKTAIKAKEDSVGKPAPEAKDPAPAPIPIPAPEPSPDVLPVTEANIKKADEILKKADEIASENEGKVAEEATKPEVAPDMKKADKPDLSLKFKKGAEDLSKTDEKSVAGIYDRIKDSPDATVKIISYYSVAPERNVAFSRLLNVRKILLDKNIPSSQIMIMVLEDDTPKSTKNNTVEIVVIGG
ncbi:MAG: hypothetical protein LBO78_01330 [Rickettsiales bacterium]|jgi:hypothetical protein|nr:hypothetical protein [Rickettsiales bacterium]